MAPNQTLMRVAVIVSAVSERHIQQCTPGARWNDIGVDSLSLAEILTACEREFNCDLPDGECEYLSTVGELASLVQKHTKVTP
jgi:acyl carrier protein